MSITKEFQKCSSSCSKKYYTHICMYPYKRSYYIENNNTDYLYDLYCKEQFTNELDVGIGEKINGACPILVDIDIKRNISDEKEFVERPLYSVADVEYVIKIYHDMLNTLFSGKLSAKYYRCVVLEKPGYLTDDGNYYKNGFHLHFPYAFFSVDDHRNHILPFVKDKVNEHFGQQVFDESVVRNPWLMYGSKKASTMDAYTITKIYDEQMNECKNDILNDYELFDANGEKIRFDDVNRVIPRILSIIPNGREILEIPIQPMDSVFVQQITRQTRNSVEINVSEKSQSENLEKVRKLLPLLSDARAADRNTWIQVGWIIYNACGPGKESLNLWIEFSKKCEDKFDLNACIREWSKMTPGNLNLGTLFFYAGIDSPRELSKLKYDMNHNKNLLHQALSGADYDVASILHRDYKDFFRCTNIKEKEWYVFVDHYWQSSDSGVDLSQKISKELVSQFVNVKRELIGEEGGLMDDDGNADRLQQEQLKKRKEACDKLIHKLKTTAFKTNVMKQCCELFYDKDFKGLLDMNPNLIAFQNGVYDVQNHSFRPGMPSDLISKKMPINYEEFDEYDPRLLYVEKYLTQVFPDKSIREYFLDTTCKMFKGGNTDRKVYVWTGEGTNGKSFTQKIIENMLGRYSASLSPTTITGKRAQSGAAAPELARCGNGVRWVSMNEPDDGEINPGILKSLSGNDAMFVRDLFEKGKTTKEMTPMFKMVIICNDLPPISKSDPAVWTRIRVIPFESTFVNRDNLPKGEAEQLRQKKFLIDYDLDSKIPQFVTAFAYKLLEHYKQTGGRIRQEPQKVKVATDRYRSSQDVFRQFIIDYIEEIPDAIISLSELYQTFKNWYIEECGYPKHSCFKRHELKEKIIRVWGDTLPNTNAWSGYAFKKNMNGPMLLEE